MAVYGGVGAAECGDVVVVASVEGVDVLLSDVDVVVVGLVEVVRQLAEGDQVVVAGQQRVQRDGQAVRVTSPTGQNSGEGASGAFRAVPAPGLAGLPLAASAPGQNPCAALIAAPRR